MPVTTLTDTDRIRLLAPPSGRVSIVLDTDTYNEIDDQFALVYALLSPERVRLEAIYAAPFHNQRSSGPGDGMEKSYQEIERLLSRLNRSPEGFVFRGSTTWLPAPDQPVHSAAAADLVARAKTPRDGPLYVVAIGAITNVVSALLLAPEIAERIVVVWLGGHPTYWPHTREFNLQGDLPASQMLFDSGVALVHVPCINVTQQLKTTEPELAKYVRDQGPVGEYLYQIFVEYHDDHFARSKEIWDLGPVAYLVNPTWFDHSLTHSPILTRDTTWSIDPHRHLIRTIHSVNRDQVFGDLFRKLAARSGDGLSTADGN